MKYLREVTPYFRKTSALNELGWGAESLPREGSLGRSGAFADKKSIPIKLCYLCRNFSMPDPQHRIFELHSPDQKSSCMFRCPDEHIANQWFNAVHANLHVLIQQAQSEANHILSSAASSSGELKAMGWLAEQVIIRGYDSYSILNN